MSEVSKKKKTNKQTKQNRKANKPTKRARVAQQTNEFIGLHVYVGYTIVQHDLSTRRHGMVTHLHI